jgi:hypothetical protein
LGMKLENWPPHKKVEGEMELGTTE